MAILVLVRHAQTIWNAEERWQGQTDIPLSPEGEVEVGHLARRLARERFDLVVMGRHARGRIAGSIASSAPCTVVTMPITPQSR